MPKQTLYVGETTRLRAVFTSNAKDGNPEQPVEITVLLPDSSKNPDSATCTVENTNTFYYDFTCTQSGAHKAKFRSTDGAVEIYDFTVEPDPVN